MSNKLFYLISSLAVVAVIAFFILVPPSGSSQTSNTQTLESNSKMEGDKQIIEITAKGGYFPRTVNAKANTETLLKVTTPGTYDCSLALYIPDLEYSKTLPSKGVTEIKIPKQPKGKIMKGMCSMGMYRFNINFN